MFTTKPYKIFFSLNGKISQNCTSCMLMQKTRWYASDAMIITFLQEVMSGAHHQDIPVRHGVFADRSIFSLNLSGIQIPTAHQGLLARAGMSTWCQHVHVRSYCFIQGFGFILTEACSCGLELAYLEEKKFLKIDWFVKMLLHWLQALSNTLLVMYIISGVNACRLAPKQAFDWNVIRHIQKNTSSQKSAENKNI